MAIIDFRDENGLSMYMEHDDFNINIQHWQDGDDVQITIDDTVMLFDWKLSLVLMLELAKFHQCSMIDNDDKN